MNAGKIKIWIAAAMAVVIGSLLIYLGDYKNNAWLPVLSHGMVFLGWLAIFMKISMQASINATPVVYKNNRAAWFKQKGFNIFLIIMMLIIGVTNMLYLSKLSQQRKDDILANQPTQTTTAVVNYIEARKAKSSMTYYAIFQYTVNGGAITHPWRENNQGDFKPGDKYEIKYSVEYPDMFLLVRQVQ